MVPIIKFVPAGIDTHFLVAGEKCLCAVVWEGWIAAPIICGSGISGLLE